MGGRIIKEEPDDLAQFEKMFGEGEPKLDQSEQLHSGQLIELFSNALNVESNAELKGLTQITGFLFVAEIETANGFRHQFAQKGSPALVQGLTCVLNEYMERQLLDDDEDN